MTEQEITQARSDVDQLDIEQLRCGVLLQLLHIEQITKERDAHRTQVEAQNTEISCLKLERDALMSSAKLAWVAIVELRYSNSTDKSRSVSEFAVQALRDAGVQ